MTKRTEIAELGEFGLIDHITANFKPNNPSTLKAAGDDAAILNFGGEECVAVSSDLLLEGINFDLVYFPLRHLGFKSVVVGISDILAMNAIPSQITVSIGVSAKLSVEHIEEFYDGIRTACEVYNVDLAGGDTTASVNGLTISVTAIGHVKRDKIAYRSGAGKNDLVCITGDLGAAYMGLHLLEREKRALEGVENPQPRFEGYEYILRRQLKPSARLDIIELLRGAGIVPTSMIDLSDGLASDILQICRSSKCGVRIYLERIPISSETHRMAEELNSDPVVAALNGGDDHELLFTIPLEMQEKVMALSGGIEIIGHITDESTGAYIITPDRSEIAIQAQGFK